MTIEIRLDGDPVGKGRHRHRLGVKAGPDGIKRPFVFSHPDSKTASFEAKLGYAAQIAMRNKPLLEGPLIVTVMAFRSVPASWSEKKRQKAFLQYLTPTGRPDCDNYLKLCMDSLNKIVWNDDAQVVEAHVYKKFSERPRLEISISPLDISI